MREGFELMARCLKENKFAAGCAVRVLSYATSGDRCLFVLWSLVFISLGMQNKLRASSRGERFESSLSFVYGAWVPFIMQER